MRQAVAALGAFAFSFTLAIFSYSIKAEASPLPLDRGPSFQQLITQLQTPESIAKFLWKNFQFESDQRQFGQSEYWQTPQEFLIRRKGDCEDFAIFAQALLKQNGIQSFLFNVYGGKFAHTVCVFKENGKYQIIDGSKIIRFNAKNLNDLAFKIYPFWKTAAIVAPSSHGKGRILSEMHK